MKRIGLVTLAMVLAVLVGVSPLFADVTWKNTNQITIAWDAVTTLNNGNPIPVGFSVLYRIYTRIFGTISEVEVTSLAATQVIITFSDEGRYLVGAKAVRLEDATGLAVSESEISWSDNPAVVSSAGTFGVIYYLPLANPKNVR